jgi:MOSC domain-containing protein YiiM
MSVETYVSPAELGRIDWATLCSKKTGSGTLEFIVVRKAEEKRETPASVGLTEAGGVLGDRWSLGESPRSDNQITLTNMSVARALCGSDEKLPQFGDNFFVEFDLSEAALPIGSKIRIGEAILEVTPEPHNGCAKFARRFSHEALRIVNIKEHKHLKLRGVHACVRKTGKVSLGDKIEIIEE